MVPRALVLIGLSVGLLWPVFGRAATFTVGNDPACLYGSIQSAVDAAEMSGDPDIDIRIARSGTYSNTAIDITDRSLRLVGGYDSCSDPEPSGRTTLSGTGGASDTVIDIVGSSTPTDVFLINLGITGGDPGTNNYGGGIAIGGNVDVVLNNVAVTSSTADLGGGIYIDGRLGASLFVDQDSTISSNTARLGGGGIYCTDVGGEASSKSVRVDAPLIGNGAVQGGGVYAQSCSYLHRANPGGNELVLNNATDSGGAIFADGSSVITLSGNPNALVNVTFNTAGADGGGISLDGGSRLDALNAAMISNMAAGDGGAVYIGRATATVDSLGRCSLDRCSRVELNEAASEGGAIFHRGGELTVRRTWIIGNNAPDGSALKSQGELVTFESVVIAENSGATSVLRLTEGAYSIIGATFADNEDMNATMLVTGGSFELKGSILWDGVGASVLFFSEEPTWDIDCLVAHDPEAIPGSPVTVLTGNPLFVDAIADDYRLTAASPAVDACDNFTGLISRSKLLILGPTDIDGLPRGTDLPNVPNLLGSYDIGASERQELLFSDSFESGGILF